MTKDELEKSILSGDQQKQDHMRYLIQALPFHSDEIETLEKLAKKAATTRAPQVAPEIPAELKKLLGEHGLLDRDGNPIELAPLPVSPNADSPSSILEHDSNRKEEELTLAELQEQVKKASHVTAKDYEAFKPIETGEKNVTSDMESFLKQFGLMDGEDNKKRKSAKSTKVSTNSDIPSIDSAYLIPGYSTLLDNIGITTIKEKSGKKINTRTNSNVFRPEHKKKAGDDDYKKLEQLLETIRELEKLNASLTEKEVNRLNLQNYNFSDSLLAGGPDPVNYQIHYSALKNEVKRQEPGDEPTRISLELTGPLLESSLEATDDGKVADDDESSKSSSSTSTSTSTTTEAPSATEDDDLPSSTVDGDSSSTKDDDSESPKAEDSTKDEDSSSVTEEAKKNSLEDEIEPIEDPEPLPPPRRSGFYMLFDWNSFLEVGEDPEKIVLRFDPKIGDPSRFLPVNVP